MRCRDDKIWENQFDYDLESPPENCYHRVMKIPTRKSVILRYGIIAGCVLMLCWMIEYFLGIHTKELGFGPYCEFLSFLLFFLIIFLGTRKISSDSLTFGRSVWNGSLMTICSTILFTLFMLWYLKSINPHYGDFQIAYQQDQLVQEGVPDDILIQKVNAMRLEYGVGALIIRTFFRTLLEGLVCSALASGLVRSKRFSPK